MTRQADRNAERQDPKGLGPEGMRAAVCEADAPTTYPMDNIVEVSQAVRDAAAALWLEVAHASEEIFGDADAWHKLYAQAFARFEATTRATQPEAALREALRAEIINTPETADFMAGVSIEAAHQRERWGVDHDAGKSPFDWFWLIGYLAQKAADAAVRGDADKAMHHTISTAAALANWHAALAGTYTAMRPGIGPDNGGEKPGSAHSLAAALKDHRHG